MLRCLPTVLPFKGRVGLPRYPVMSSLFIALSQRTSTTLSSVTPSAPIKVNKPYVYNPKPEPSLFALRKILASEDTSTANRVKSYYTSLSARSQLTQLSPHDMSSLIALFGSLSSPDRSHPSRFFSRQTANVKAQPDRDYWGFMFQVAKDKCRFSQPLMQSDCYWLMQAHLARSNTDAASIYYKRLAPLTSHQQFHASYLTTLLEEGAVDAFVNTTSYLLEKHKSLPSSLFSIFQTFVAKHHASDEHKIRVANALSARFGQHSHEMTSVNWSQSLDARGLMGLLEKAFKDPRQGNAWIANLLASLFASSRTVEDRWDNLLLLVFAVTANHSSTSFSPHNSEANDVATVTWRTILLIATTQGLASISPPSALPQLQHIVRAVWKPFAALPITMSDAGVRRVLITTTLRLANGMKDGVIVETCGRHCLQEMEVADAGSDKALLIPMLTELCVASIICSRYEWNRILLTRSEHFSTTEVASRAVYRLIRLDLEAALKMHSFCSKWRVEISPDVTHSLGCRLASIGRVRQALDYLSVPNYTLHQRESLVRAFLHPGHSQQRLSLEPSVIKALLPVLRSIVQDTPSPAFAPHLQCLLLYLVTKQQASSAIDLFLRVFKVSPHYFQPAFSVRLADTLLSHRQYKLATRLVRELDKSRTTSPLGPAFITSLVRAGAHSLAKRHWSRTRGRQPTSPTLQLCRRLSFRVDHPHTLPSLAIVPFVLRYRRDVEMIQLALTILVRVGRLSAARRVFALLAPALDDKTKTFYGNIILSGTAMRCSRSARNRRLLRQVLHTLESLKNSFGFLEDGVTKNIVLGATLRWRGGLTGDQLRALYDLQSHSRQGRTSFNKHIGPMYKLFIKTFHLRGDRHGARIAIRKLKGEKEQFEEESARRQQARSKGRRKATMR